MVTNQSSASPSPFCWFVSVRSQCYFCDFVTFLALPMWLFFPEGTTYPNIVKTYLSVHILHTTMLQTAENNIAATNFASATTNVKLTHNNRASYTITLITTFNHSAIWKMCSGPLWCNVKILLYRWFWKCCEKDTDDVVLLISAIIKYCKLLEITRKPQRSIVQIKATALLWIMNHTWPHSATQGFSGYRTLRAIISDVLQK